MNVTLSVLLMIMMIKKSGQQETFGSDRNVYSTDYGDDSKDVYQSVNSSNCIY